MDGNQALRFLRELSRWSSDCSDRGSGIAAKRIHRRVYRRENRRGKSRQETHVHDREVCRTPRLDGDPTSSTIVANLATATWSSFIFALESPKGDDGDDDHCGSLHGNIRPKRIQRFDVVFNVSPTPITTHSVDDSDT